VPNKLIASLAGATFSLATSGFAFAADMAVKAPPPAPAPAPVYSWTGFYVGGNIGASFGDVKTDFNVGRSTVNVFQPPGTFIGSIPVRGFAGSDRTYPSGFIGGGQIGYNWQFSPIWVVGFEADFQGALEKESSTITNPLSFGTAFGFLTGSTVLDYQTKIEWFGTVRGRIGYVWGNGAVLSYVTGGLAYGSVGIDGTSTVSGIAGGQIPFSVTQAIGHSQVNTGWVVGAGTEGKLLIPGWTLKAEALYMDLGTLDATGSGGPSSTVITFPGAPPVNIVTTAGQVATHSHFTDSILRVGLNYQFH
jgi:outer membrane immunogenic protein